MNCMYLNPTHRVANKLVSLSLSLSLLSRQRRKRCAQPRRTDWAHRYIDGRGGGGVGWGGGGGGVCVFASARVRACMRACAMCLQYTIMIFDPG